MICDGAAKKTLVRQALYRFCAASLLYPGTKRLLALQKGARWLLGALDTDVFNDYRPLKQACAAASQSANNNCVLEEIQSEWVRLFGVSRDGYCFPYEGAYRSPQMAGQLLAELQQEYARAGVSHTDGDLPDHISVELEYMSYLCDLERQTLGTGEVARRDRILRAEKRFLERHLGQWLPQLTARVKEANKGTFAMVCAAASDLVVADLAAAA